MRKVILQQGSDEWKAWRLTRYTASNAAAVMNCNPWFPRNQKALQKLLTGQQEVRENPYMKAGTRDEDMIRSLIESITGHDYPPSCWETEVVVAKDQDYGLDCYDPDSFVMMLGASLDCFSESSGIIWDIKRPNKGSQDEYLQKKEIKPHCHWQLVHQLICTPAREAGLCYYAHDIGEIVFTETIKRDSEQFLADKEKLISAWKDFDAKMTEF